MKKYFYLLLTIILFTPIIVLGDSAGPYILGYDAVVINSNGAKYEDYNDGKQKIIPYNTKVHVYDENDNYNDNLLYATICLLGDNNCEHGSMTVLLSDLAPLKEEISPNDIKGRFDANGNGDETHFESSSDKLIVFEKNGIYLSKGPSDIYGKYDNKIEYMTFLKSSYVLICNEYGGDDTPTIYWYYIDDGVNKGWLKQTSHYLGYNMGIFNKTKLVFTDTKIYDENGNLVLTIPSETILNEIYYIGREERYFIKYNGKEGYTKDNNFGKLIKDELIVTVRDAKIISIDGKVRGEIPLGKSFNSFYGNYKAYNRDEDVMCGVLGLNNKKYYYVEYNKVKGFVDADNIKSFVSYDIENVILQKKEITFEQDVNMYEFKSENNYYEEINDYKIIDKIPSGTKVISLYSYTSYYDDDKKDYTYYLINYKGIPGWVVIEGKTDNNENSKNEESKPTNVIPQKKVNNKSNDTLYYAIGGAVLVSVVAVITVIMVNKSKKKDKKVNESTDEKKDIKEVKETIDNEPRKKHNVLEGTKDTEEKDTEKKD